LKANLKQRIAGSSLPLWFPGSVFRNNTRFGLDRVMTMLAITSQCVIAMTFLVINLEKGVQAPLF
jgi:hypothetical protein